MGLLQLTITLQDLPNSRIALGDAPIGSSTIEAEVLAMSFETMPGKYGGK